MKKMLAVFLFLISASAFAAENKGIFTGSFHDYFPNLTFKFVSAENLAVSFNKFSNKYLDIPDVREAQKKMNEFAVANNYQNYAMVNLRAIPVTLGNYLQVLVSFDVVYW